MIAVALGLEYASGKVRHVYTCRQYVQHQDCQGLVIRPPVFAKVGGTVGLLGSFLTRSTFSALHGKINKPDKDLGPRIVSEKVEFILLNKKNFFFIQQKSFHILTVFEMER